MSNPQSGPGDHYFSARPDSASAPNTVQLILPEGVVVELSTDRGVFSADAVDVGTRVLLSEAPSLEGARDVADVGCGYGPIAITMALRSGPGTTVWAVDVNERARQLCELNARAAGVGDRVRVVAPDQVPTDLVLDQIWTNPPIRVGKANLHELLTTWLDRLAPGGAATLVVHKHLGSDSLARWLTAEGWATRRSASRAGYRILTVASRSEKQSS